MFPISRFAKRGCKAFLVSIILVSSGFIYIFGNPTAILTILETEEPEILNYRPPSRRAFHPEMLRNPFAFSCFQDDATQLKNISSFDELRDTRLFSDLQEFSSVIASLGVPVAIIEPSVLFCMLSEKYAETLQRRYTVPSSSDNVFSLAVDADSAAILETSEAKRTFDSNGYRLEFVKRPTPDWMSLNSSTFVGHIFCRRQEGSDLVFHLVVFHRRRDFLWHSSMLAGEGNNTLGMHFVDHDAAYENFSMVSLDFASSQLANLSIVSDPQFFLFEMAASRFLECNQSVVSEYGGIASNSLPDKHTKWMSVGRFDRRAHIALREVKNVFDPLLMRFWIWSGTMLGWYRQCGVISYTSDVDFAADASQLGDLEALMAALEKSEHIQIKEKYGMPSKGLEFNLGVHFLRVDVFFLYYENNGTWYAGHRPSRKYYFKYHHPFFTLCSTELLGQKVHVPCQTEDVIRAEYGPKWIHPVSSWNYETSIFNRGPNINWTAEELEQGVYTNF